MGSWIACALLAAQVSEPTLTGVHWADPSEYAMLRKNGVDFVVATAAPGDLARQRHVLDAAEATGMRLIFGAYPEPYVLKDGAWSITAEGAAFLELLKARPKAILALFVYNEPYWVNPFTKRSDGVLGGLSAAELRVLRTKIRSVWPEAKIYHDLGAPGWWAPGGDGGKANPELGNRYADATGVADYVGIWSYPFKTRGPATEASLKELAREMRYVRESMAPAQPVVLGQASSAPPPDDLVFPTRDQFADWSAALRRLTPPAISWYVWRQGFYPDELSKHPDYLPLLRASEARTLFNRRDLEGWTAVGTAVWKADGGILVGGQDGDPKRSGVLHTTGSFRDFELELDVMIDERGKYNSGIYLRNDPGNAGQSAYQVNIGRAEAGEYTGGIVVRRDGKIVWLAKGDEKDAIRKKLDWNSLRILIRGARLQVALNGGVVSDVEDPAPEPRLLEPGVVALQTYGADGHAGWVKFRNLRIRELK